jgi:hypothetical protein
MKRAGFVTRIALPSTTLCPAYTDGGSTMTRFLVYASLLLGPAVAGAHDVAQDERDLLRVETALCHAFEEGDAGFLRGGLDRSFTLTDSHGEATDYGRNISDVAKREPRYEVFRNHEQKVRLYGDAAIVTGVTTVKGTAGKDAFSADFQYTDTWIRRDGHWKMAASHASRLQHPASRP